MAEDWNNMKFKPFEAKKKSLLLIVVLGPPAHRPPRRSISKPTRATHLPGR
jgi:hypothetical protein